MKKFITEFLRRGAMACGIGPIVLAAVYIIMHYTSELDSLTVFQIAVGIVSISALAFIAGGINALYQIESLPLMAAILIHGVVLYTAYFATYFINDWLDFGIVPFIVFTAIFIVGYAVIWTIVYTITKKHTTKINKILQKKQENA